MTNLRCAKVYSGNCCTGKEYIIPELPECPKLANAYVPYQCECDYQIYSPMEGLAKGTIFPQLHSEYHV